MEKPLKEIGNKRLTSFFFTNALFAIFAIVVAIGQIVSVGQCCKGHSDIANNVYIIAIITASLAGILLLFSASAPVVKFGYAETNADRITEINGTYSV
jgi:hypothetical protein